MYFPLFSLWFSLYFLILSTLFLVTSLLIDSLYVIVMSGPNLRYFFLNGSSHHDPSSLLLSCNVGFGCFILMLDIFVFTSMSLVHHNSHLCLFCDSIVSCSLCFCLSKVTSSHARATMVIVFPNLAFIGALPVFVSLAP